MIFCERSDTIASYSLQSMNLEDLEHWAGSLAQVVRGLDVTTSCTIALRGSLGAGKTTLVRYLLQALGVKGRIKSPSYALVEAYELAHLPWTVWHFDLYRLSDPQAWQALGFGDIWVQAGLKLIEWPNMAQGWEQVLDLCIDLHWSDEAQATDTRHLQIHAHHAQAAQWLKQCFDGLKKT